MWRGWFSTLPFYCLLGNVVGNRAMMSPAFHSFWGQRYPQLCGRPCNNEIEIIKNSLVRKCGENVEGMVS